MKKHVLSGLCLIMAVAGQAQELFIADFEQQPIYNSLYFDLEDPNLAHPLINNSDQPILNVAPDANHLGYSAYYTPYDDPSTGLSDGDQVGITDDTATVGTFYEGTQGYVLSDIDGNFTLNFTEVPLQQWTQAMVSCSLFIKESIYEGDGTQNTASSDRIAIYVSNPDKGAKIDLLDTTGHDIDALDIEGRWLNLSAQIPGFDRAQLVIEARNNASNEAFYIDDIRFEGQLSVSDFSETQSVAIPNPMEHNFSLLRRPARLKEIYIQNIFGRIVWRGVTRQNTWEVTELNSGLYFLNIAQDHKTWTQKIIKK